MKRIPADKRDEALGLATLWTRGGMSRAMVEVRLCGQYDIDIEGARALISVASASLAESVASQHRPEFVAQQMDRLEALAVKAQEEGNLAVALGCYKELHALAKLT